MPFLLPIRSVVFPLIFVIGSAVTGSALAGISSWWSVTATLVNIAVIIMLVLIAKKDGKTYWEFIGCKKGATKAKQVIAVTAVVLLVGMGGMYLAGFICYGKFPYLAPMMIEPIPPVLAIINLPLLPVTTALAEDGLYLGCGVNRIKNKYAAVLVPAFFFALQHSFIPTLPDLRYIAYRFLSFLPLTVILCRHYYKTRNPLPVMIGHAVIDAATVIMILVMSLDPGLYDKMLEMM